MSPSHIRRIKSADSAYSNVLVAALDDRFLPFAYK
jgi:hypothetical protein